jgi:hypothetical protein
METLKAITLGCAEFLHDNLNRIVLLLHTRNSRKLHVNAESLNYPLGTVTVSWTTKELEEFAS